MMIMAILIIGAQTICGTTEGERRDARGKQGLCYCLTKKERKKVAFYGNNSKQSSYPPSSTHRDSHKCTHVSCNGSMLVVECGWE